MPQQYDVDTTHQDSSPLDERLSSLVQVVKKDLVWQRRRQLFIFDNELVMMSSVLQSWYDKVGEYGRFVSPSRQTSVFLKRQNLKRVFHVLQCSSFQKRIGF
ncbi:hypothetical protein CEXT_383781 [Caerostris extrusa]|uniref:Uncharacterized protein n=1 Tax=Caerostris extrusa TaxID=172846 RepID=A0AAV4P173_CAEEX|nr:hypothetical protein CEXT_383781 [Caerostris extrusa]